jgi:hypothetical protein
MNSQWGRTGGATLLVEKGCHTGVRREVRDR